MILSVGKIFLVSLYSFLKKFNFKIITHNIAFNIERPLHTYIIGQYNPSVRIIDLVLSNNCLVIVIVYANCVNRGITNKAIVVVYIKL